MKICRNAVRILQTSTDRGRGCGSWRWRWWVAMLSHPADTNDYVHDEQLQRRRQRADSVGGMKPSTSTASQSQRRTVRPNQCSAWCQMRPCMTALPVPQAPASGAFKRCNRGLSSFPRIYHPIILWNELLNWSANGIKCTFNRVVLSLWYQWILVNKGETRERRLE